MNRREALINAARLGALSGLALLGAVLFGKRGHSCMTQASCRNCSALSGCESPFAAISKKEKTNGRG